MIPKVKWVFLKSKPKFWFNYWIKQSEILIGRYRDLARFVVYSIFFLLFLFKNILIFFLFLILEHHNYKKKHKLNIFLSQNTLKYKTSNLLVSYISSLLVLNKIRVVLKLDLKVIFFYFIVIFRFLSQLGSKTLFGLSFIN
jgi:hypothetical protein